MLMTFPPPRRSGCLRRNKDGEVVGVEDCLTLDVFTSSVIYDELKPVVVYISGDHPEDDDASPTSELAAEHDVVFVSVNYRRGALGFLATDSLATSVRPKHSGNYGLGDLVTALQWVKANAQHFGGHPKKVTLLGRGSGATLAVALTASPVAKGLFGGVWAAGDDPAGIRNVKSGEDADRENRGRRVRSP